jgi:hypothetical protein
MGPRSRWISDHDLTTRLSDEGRPVPGRVILPAQAGSDARGAGDNTELSDSNALFDYEAEMTPCCCRRREGNAIERSPEANAARATRR